MIRGWLRRIVAAATLFVVFFALAGCEHRNHNHGVRDRVVLHRHHH